MSTHSDSVTISDSGTNASISSGPQRHGRRQRNRRHNRAIRRSAFVASIKNFPNIPILQMNAKKRNPSTLFINQKCSKMDAFIAFIQENSNSDKNPSNLDKKHHRIFCKDSKVYSNLEYQVAATIPIWDCVSASFFIHLFA